MEFVIKNTLIRQDIFAFLDIVRPLPRATCRRLLAYVQTLDAEHALRTVAFIQHIFGHDYSVIHGFIDLKDQARFGLWLSLVSRLRRSMLWLQRIRNEGVSPLMHAVVEGQQGMVQWLLCHGVSLTQKDYFGDNALVYALSLDEDTAAIMIFLQLLCDNNAKTVLRETTTQLDVDMHGAVYRMVWLEVMYYIVILRDSYLRAFALCERFLSQASATSAHPLGCKQAKQKTFWFFRLLAFLCATPQSRQVLCRHIVQNPRSSLALAHHHVDACLIEIHQVLQHYQPYSMTCLR